MNTNRHSEPTDEEVQREAYLVYIESGCVPGCDLENWLKASGITSGALFRSVNRFDHVMASRLTGQSVSLIIKQRATEAGIDASRLSGHSLRAGFVTAAAQSGAPTTRIRAQTGHTSDSMLQRYIRDAELFSNNANADLWT